MIALSDQRPATSNRCIVLGAMRIVLVVCLALCYAQPARALYWEDDFPSNDPENEYRVPKGCVMGSVWDKLRRSAAGISNFLVYGGREPADTGPSLNKRKKGMVVLGCTVLGGVTGGVIGLATENENTDIMVHRVTSIGLGVICGVIVGVWVVPDSFSYDEQARWVNPDARFSEARYRDLETDVLRLHF